MRYTLSLSVLDAFGKADDTLSVAAKSIAEIITVHGLINLDFNDVKTVLKDGGVAIMSTGYGEGEGRVRKAIDDALNSPLLNDNDVFNSKKILLSISFAGSKDGKDSLMMEEMNDVNEFMAKFGDFEIKWGLATDPELGKKVKVTILATGFGIENVDGMSGHLKRHTQEERLPALQNSRSVRQSVRSAATATMATRAQRSVTSAVRISICSVPMTSTTTMSSLPWNRLLLTSAQRKFSTASTTSRAVRTCSSRMTDRRNPYKERLCLVNHTFLAGRQGFSFQGSLADAADSSASAPPAPVAAPRVRT